MMEKYEYRMPDSARVQDTELYKHAPLRVRQELDMDPNYVRHLVTYLASRQPDGEVLTYPHGHFVRQRDFHFQSIYKTLDPTSRRYIDECAEEFIDARRKRLAEREASIKNGGEERYNQQSSRDAVRRSGFHRDPKWVYDRMRSLRGENNDRIPLDERSINRAERLEKLFDKYYEGSQDFRDFAKKTYSDYPEMARKEAENKWTEEATRRRQEADELAGEEAELVNHLAGLKNSGYSKTAIMEMVERALRAFRQER